MAVAMEMHERAGGRHFSGTPIREMSVEHGRSGRTAIGIRPWDLYSLMFSNPMRSANWVRFAENARDEPIP